MAGRVTKESEFTYNLQRTWPLRRTMLCCGIVAYFASLAAIRLPLWCVLLPIALFLSLLLVPRWRRPHLLLLFGVLLLFWLSGTGYRYFQTAPLIRQDGQTDTLTGWIEELPDSGRLYTLRVTESTRLPTGTAVKLYCHDTCAPDQYQTVQATVTLTAANQRQAALQADGIFLLAFPQGREDAVTLTDAYVSSPLRHSLQPLRQYLYKQLRCALPRDEGAVVAALCLGVTRGLPAHIETAFRDSGLSHLLVVSGLHLSLITLAVAALLRRFGSRIACALTIPVVLFFMLLIGFTPSVVRAGTMCLIWLAGQLFRRRADGLNSLGFAAMLLLGHNPYAATSVGFLLSFLATAGILCLTPRLFRAFSLHSSAAEKGRLRQHVLTSLVVCGSASLFVVPLLCTYFGRFPLITPVANLLGVTPAAGALLCGWVGILLCAVPPLAFLGRPVLLCAGILSKLTHAVTRLCGRVAGIITITELWQLVLAIGGCILLVIAVRRCRRLTCCVLAGGLLAITLSAGGLDYALSRPHSVVTAASAGEGIALLTENRRQRGLLVSHSDGLRDAATLLHNIGCNRLDYLLIGEGEPNRAGELSYLLEQVAVTHVLCADSALWTAGIEGITTLSRGDRFGTNMIFWTYLGDSWRLDMPHTHLTVGGHASSVVFVPTDQTPIQYITTAKEWRTLSWL
ncbi:MAG: ComEC/Rec2 family competence protein [Clostridia bacterium]|nr:ComEC/Rec2 family competence protein [Clostridia bacterium]